MTPESQRIAIAEACGWKHDWINQGEVSENSLVWFAPNGGWVEEEDLPDFTSDLNAMHEAEMCLVMSPLWTDDMEDQWLMHLRNACSPYEDSEVGNAMAMRATASQRAEAFLRTIGKWDNTK